MSIIANHASNPEDRYSNPEHCKHAEHLQHRASRLIPRNKTAGRWREGLPVQREEVGMRRRGGTPQANNRRSESTP